MQEELLKLGFSTNQARVYLALLEIGQTTVGPIISKTGLPRQTAYNALAELKAKDLVFSVIKSGRANWQAKEPGQLLDILRSQKQLVEKLLPQLIAKRDAAKHTAEIKVYEGVDGFVTMHRINLQNQIKNTEVNIIGAAGQKWIDLMEKGKYLNKYEELRIKKQIKHHIIAYENQRPEVNKFMEEYYLHQLPSQRKKFKFLPEEYYSPVGIQIWQDRIELIIYSDQPLIFEIKSLEMVKSFAKYFKFLWGLAKN